MAKLTDSQLVILSAAAQRKGGTALPLSKSLRIKGAAVTKTLEGLCKKGLLKERPAARNSESWRETEDGRRMMLFITEAGLSAIDGGPGTETEKKSAAKKRQPTKRRGRAAQKPAGSKSKGEKSPQTTVRQGTKQSLLIDLLKRKNGASIGEIVKATGWQAHSVRGAISGALKKKLGLTVTSERRDGAGDRRAVRSSARASRAKSLGRPKRRSLARTAWIPCCRRAAGCPSTTAAVD